MPSLLMPLPLPLPLLPLSLQLPQPLSSYLRLGRTRCSCYVQPDSRNRVELDGDHSGAWRRLSEPSSDSFHRWRWHLETAKTRTFRGCPVGGARLLIIVVPFGFFRSFFIE